MMDTSCNNAGGVVVIDKTRSRLKRTLTQII